MTEDVDSFAVCTPYLRLCLVRARADYEIENSRYGSVRYFFLFFFASNVALVTRKFSSQVSNKCVSPFRTSSNIFSKLYNFEPSYSFPPREIIAIYLKS